MMTVWPMAITIGKDEAAILIAAFTATVGAAVGAMTIFGRWSGRRAERISNAKQEGEREQKEKDRIERLEQWRLSHTKEVEPLKEEFRQYQRLAEKTAQSVGHLAERVGELVASNRDVLDELRAVNNTVRRILTGEIAWRPKSDPKGGC